MSAQTRRVTIVILLLLTLLLAGVSVYVALNLQQEGQAPEETEAATCPNGSGEAIACAYYSCPYGDTSGDGQCTSADRDVIQHIGGVGSNGNCPTGGGCWQTDYYTRLNGDLPDFSSYCGHVGSVDTPGACTPTEPQETCEDAGISLNWTYNGVEYDNGDINNAIPEIAYDPNVPVVFQPGDCGAGVSGDWQIGLFPPAGGVPVHALSNTGGGGSTYENDIPLDTTYYVGCFKNDLNCGLIGIRHTAEEEPVCGDGTVDPGEECDDGNTVDDDQCTNECTIPPECGDGNVDPGEQCDDGNDIDTDSCTNACTTPVTPQCGSTCTTNSQCPTGMQCVSGVCRNPSCTTDSDCICDIPVTGVFGDSGEDYLLIGMLLIASALLWYKFDLGTRIIGNKKFRFTFLSSVDRDVQKEKFEDRVENRK